MPHALPLYIFLVCSLLVRIPWENRYVVPDCAVTAKQRDRHGFQTQRTHGFWGWRELLSAVIRSQLHRDPFTKTFPPQILRSLLTSPGWLIHQDPASWGDDSPSPALPARQAARAVPAGQLLLLPHHKLFTPQHISKLTNYGISFAGKRAFLSFPWVALYVERGDLAVKQESGRSAWAGLAGGMLHAGRYCEEGKRCEGLAAVYPHVFLRCLNCPWGFLPA